jgi:hypothetical protein
MHRVALFETVYRFRVWENVRLLTLARVFGLIGITAVTQLRGR